MLIKTASDIRSAEITSKELYLNRRQFILAASATAAGTLFGGLGAPLSPVQAVAGEKLNNLIKSPYSTAEK